MNPCVRYDLHRIVVLALALYMLCIQQMALADEVILINTIERNTKVITCVESATWHFKINSDGKKSIYNFVFRNLKGEIVKKISQLDDTDSSLIITANGLSVGYYDLELYSETQFLWKSSLVVLPDGDPPQEERFGMDAGVSWKFGGEYSQDPSILADRSFDMMKLAGIRSVRDRMGWWKLQKNENTPINWGIFSSMADKALAKGLDLVQIVDAAPFWIYPELKMDHKAAPPLDYAKVFEFGRQYALGLGRKARSVEYWNEQNLHTYFDGYPFQYASGLKAFSAGVKSVDPKIKILLGSLAAGDPFLGVDDHQSLLFQEETFANNVANFFDLRNAHYYRDRKEAYGKKLELTLFDTFYSRNFAEIERQYMINDRPGWLTETGYRFFTGEDGNREFEILQAQYLVRTYVTGFASGYERVFYFFWPYLVENAMPYYIGGKKQNFTNWKCINGIGIPPIEQQEAQGQKKYQIWGITRCDASPRPAYFALALLTRHLNGASIVGVEKHGAQGRTVYFRRADASIVAVTWGGNSNVLNLPSITVRDIFGREVTLPNTDSEKMPLLVSNIRALPSAVMPVTLPKSISLPKNPLWLEARVKVAGREILSRNHQSLSEVIVEAGQVMELAVRAHDGNSTNSKAYKFQCVPGPSLDVSYEGWQDDQYSCHFTVGSSLAGGSYATINAYSGNKSDTVRVALRVYPPVAKSFCGTWSKLASSKALTEIYQQNGTCAVTVKSEFKEIGNIWIFPWLAITPQTMLSTRSGIRVRINDILGWGGLRAPLQVTLWEKWPSGEKWLLNLSKTADGSYIGLFRDVKNQLEGGVGNKRLDLIDVTRILIGGAFYAGHPGKLGFRIETVEWLQSGSTLNFGENFLPYTVKTGQQLVSENSRFKLVLGQDRNARCYDSSGQIVWALKWDTIPRTSGDRVTLEDNGELVVYAKNGEKKWSSHSTSTCYISACAGK
ncbi:MAG: hypothetical protein LBK55_03400 [Azoarcus sp.]|nr:hypothetical protein [Azoarcus sp.]